MLEPFPIQASSPPCFHCPTHRLPPNWGLPPTLEPLLLPLCVAAWLAQVHVSEMAKLWLLLLFLPTESKSPLHEAPTPSTSWVLPTPWMGNAHGLSTAGGKAGIIAGDHSLGQFCFQTASLGFHFLPSIKFLRRKCGD